MPHATIADVEGVIGAATLAAISDHDGNHLRDDAVVLEALENASALADTYINEHLPVPTPAPRALKRAVIAIACNDLREAREMGTEASRLMFASAIKWLTDVSAGKAELEPGKPPAEFSAADPGDPETFGLDRVWSRHSARGVF